MTGLPIFTTERLQKVIKETLPQNPAPGEKVLVATVNSQGARVLAAFKNVPHEHGFNWELQAVAEHEWTGDNSVEGNVVLRWQ